MLSAVIRSRHSYGAMHLAVQPPDQRSVHFGPLVLETALLKNQRLQQIKPNLSHACFSHITVCIGLYLHPSIISGWLTSSLYGRRDFLKRLRFRKSKCSRSLERAAGFPRCCPSKLIEWDFTDIS